MAVACKPHSSAKNALVGATGAATAEMVGMIAANPYGKPVSELSETEKQTVSALATLAAGLAGGLTGDTSADAIASAKAGQTTVENNFLSATKAEDLIKAIEDQKAGKNLVEASKTLLRLTNEDRASNLLLEQYQKGPPMTDGQKQELAGLLNQYGYDLQTVYGYSPQKAADAIQSLVAGKVFVASTGDTKAYNEALSYLKGYSVQSGQAAIGTDALLALPGAPGIIARSTLAASGGYQTGIGIGQTIDGKYGEGALNIGLGTAAIFGGMAGQNVINKAQSESALTKGQLTYEFGAKPDGNELRAGSAFSELGYDVTYKVTASDRGVSGVQTQDLWVKDIGKVDVYTPKNANQKTILRGIEDKNKQTTSVFIQAEISTADMQSIAMRTWGKPSANNINTLFFQDAKGNIVRFERPIKK